MSAAPAGPWSENKSITRRFRFVQSIIDLFWGKWTLYYFPRLVLRGVPFALPCIVGLTSEMQSRMMEDHKKVTAMFGIMVSLAELGFFFAKWLKNG